MKIIMSEDEYLIYSTYLENKIHPLAALLQLVCITEPELLIVPNESEEPEPEVKTDG